jgi:hypothetical protein
MSAAVMLREQLFTRSTKRKSAFSFSDSPDVSKSRITPAMKASASICVPDSTSHVCCSSTAATAAWDFSQNGQALRAEVKAAISSRIQGLIGPGSRMISCVKRAR